MKLFLRIGALVLALVLLVGAVLTSAGIVDLKGLFNRGKTPSVGTEEYKAYVRNDIGELVEVIVSAVDLNGAKLERAGYYYDGMPLYALWPYAYLDDFVLDLNGGFYDAVSIPMTRETNGVATTLDGYYTQFKNCVLHDPDMGYMILDALANHITIRSLELGADFQPVLLGEKRPDLREYATTIKRNGLPAYIGQIDSSVTLHDYWFGEPYDHQVINAEMTRMTGAGLLVLDLFTPVGITNTSPDRHYFLDRTVQDSERIVELTDYEETRDWLVLELRTKGGFVVARIGINLDDMRIGIYDLETPITPPVNPTPTPTDPVNPTPTPVPPGPDPTPTPVPPGPDPTPTPTPQPTPTPTPVPTEPVKDPDDDRVVHPQPGDQGTGPADVTQTEEPDRFQPTQPPQATTPPRTVEDDKPSQQTPATPAPPAVTKPDDSCADGTAIRDDTAGGGTPPAVQSAEEGNREVQQKPPEIASQPPVTDSTVTEDDFDIPLD